MASENLVIVESPAKAKTINKILGGNYRIAASMGHVRDLPDKSFGVDIEHDFAPRYCETKGRERVIRQLVQQAKEAKHVFLAPDPDREGEAIAWHLRELLKEKAKVDFHRVAFHEITKSAINKAFATPTEINMDLVNSQQARRILDRLVGYKVSPLLWSRIERGISAGRVQSVALRLVCEREREIQAFVPEEYWVFTANLEATAPGSGKEFQAKLVRIDGQPFKIDNQKDADHAANAIKGGGPFNVTSVEVKPRQKRPAPPFITSTLQQAAGGLRFSANFTMRIAQQLYEGVDLGDSGPTGLITYMRTDSVNVAAEAREACRSFVANTMGPDYIPEKPNFYRSKSGAQEAHEAIRPTDVTLTPEKLKNQLDAPQFKLYTLIWRRFVASQMSPAQQKRTVVETTIKGTNGVEYGFRTTATVTTFPGFTKVYDVKSAKEQEEQTAPAILAELKNGDACHLKELLHEQKFTEPPPRYTEARLIRELEENGVGRPSTYASIVNTIQNRKYVIKTKGSLIPEELGFKVNDYLVAMLPELFQVGFTAEMEEKLDKIEEGNVEWTDMLRAFYDRFATWLDDAKQFGAPSADKAKSLVSMLENVAWNPPRKAGKRTYDDGKFFKSVKSKFESDGKITERQWESLLRLAVDYEKQLPDLDAVAQREAFQDDLREARDTNRQREDKQRRMNDVSDEDKQRLSTIFTSFGDVEWEAPVTKGKRVYDDAKFFESLKQQFESGKNLSDKQRRALGRMAVKYKSKVANFDDISEWLDVKQDGADAERNNAEVKELLEELGKVQEWAEPVKKGRRVYDDKEFFQSLSAQFEQGKTFSSRQVSALKRLASKYREKD